MSGAAGIGQEVDKRRRIAAEQLGVQKDDEAGSGAVALVAGGAEDALVGPDGSAGCRRREDVEHGPDVDGRPAAAIVDALPEPAQRRPAGHDREVAPAQLAERPVISADQQRVDEVRVGLKGKQPVLRDSAGTRAAASRAPLPSGTTTAGCRARGRGRARQARAAGRR